MSAEFRASRHTWHFLRSASAIALALQCGQAFAQEPQAAAVVEEEDIVVVGKRGQAISDVSGKVDIVSAEELQKIGAKDSEDIFKLTPGVQFNKGAADGSLLTIRGVGINTSSDNTSVGQLPTGIYIEDVPFTDPFQYISTPDISAFDLDAVQVLRGPQGALYGSGSLGGAVNYTFHKPELDQFGGSVLATMDIAQGGEVQGSIYGALNLPVVTDVLAFRFVGQMQNDPGYQDNIGTGRRNVNGRSVDGVRAMARFKPNDRLTIDALYMVQKSSQDDTSASIGPDVRVYDSPRPSWFKSRFSLGKLEINYDLGGVTLTSLTAYQDKKRNFDGDLTRLMVPDLTVGIDVPSQDYLGFGPFPQVSEGRNVERRSSDAWSQEFRIASDQTGKFKWLVGVFGQDVNFHRVQNVYLVGANDPVVDDLFFNVQRDGKAKERAVFGEASLSLGGLELGVGGRYFHTSVEFTQSRLRSFAAGPSSAVFSHSENGFTPKVEARYKFADDTVAYALAAKGFRFGGVNTGVGAKPYNSDNLWNYEVGLRLQPASTLNLDLGAFYIDWRNPQVTSADQNGFLLLSNLDSAVTKGAEVAVRWRPLPGLRLNGTATYTDAKMKASFESTRNWATDVAGGYSGNFVVPAGTSLPGTPKVQASFQPDYTMDGPAGTTINISGTVTYTGARRAQIDSDLRLPAFTTADVRVKVSTERFEVGLGVSNLFNVKGVSQGSYSYFSTGTGTDGYADFYLIRPRIYSLSVRANF
jgi:outer membrane receptor protein involved in Fe transport